MKKNKLYITTPIYYVNDSPHLGHAYTTIAADVLARWNRQMGYDVYFSTGTDEHGEKIMHTADKNKIEPKIWCDNLVNKEWKPLWQKLNISNNCFVRTTNEHHKKEVKNFIQKLYNSNYIYKGVFNGLYCTHCEEFKKENELLKINNNFICIIHKKEVKNLKEQNYFFRLSSFQKELLNLYKEKTDFILPISARNEVIKFIEMGLDDISISRSSFDWGIKVPWDTSNVIYVWIDALINYVSAVSDSEKTLIKYFPPDIHMIGKDILRFHAIIWPAMLMALGMELPKKIVANGWLLVNGEKMSKSNSTGISPINLIDNFGSDAYRYYFLKSFPYGADGTFSIEDFVSKYNADLANSFGNLVSRVTAMIDKYFNGYLPVSKKITSREEKTKKIISNAILSFQKAMKNIMFNNALSAIFRIVNELNLYITEQEPWKLANDAKKDKYSKSYERLSTTLFLAADSLRIIAALLNPFMPNVTKKLWGNLGLCNNIELENVNFLMNSDNTLKSSAHRINKCDALFPAKRLEDVVKNV